MAKEERVLLVRVVLGRGTVRHYPINQDQATKIFTVKDSGKEHGAMIEMIPAIKKFGCYHTVVTLPDKTEQIGNVFFKAKDYQELADTALIRKGIINLCKQQNKFAEALIKLFQCPKNRIEHKVESLAITS